MKVIINGVCFDTKKDEVVMIWDNQDDLVKATKSIYELNGPPPKAIPSTPLGVPRFYAVAPRGTDINALMDRALKIYLDNNGDTVEMTW